MLKSYTYDAMTGANGCYSGWSEEPKARNSLRGLSASRHLADEESGRPRMTDDLPWNNQPNQATLAGYGYLQGLNEYLSKVTILHHIEPYLQIIQGGIANLRSLTAR